MPRPFKWSEPDVPEGPEPDAPQWGMTLRPRKPKGTGICNTAQKFPIVATSPQKRVALGSHSSDLPPQLPKPSFALSTETRLRPYLPLPFVTGTEGKTKKHQANVGLKQVQLLPSAATKKLMQICQSQRRGF